MLKGKNERGGAIAVGLALVLEQHEYAYDEDWTVRVDDRRAHYDCMRA